MGSPLRARASRCIDGGGDRSGTARGAGQRSGLSGASLRWSDPDQVQGYRPCSRPVLSPRLVWTPLAPTPYAVAWAIRFRSGPFLPVEGRPGWRHSSGGAFAQTAPRAGGLRSGTPVRSRLPPLAAHGFGAWMRPRRPWGHEGHWRPYAPISACARNRLWRKRLAQNDATLGGRRCARGLRGTNDGAHSRAVVGRGTPVPAAATAARCRPAGPTVAVHGGLARAAVCPTLPPYAASPCR